MSLFSFFIIILTIILLILYIRNYNKEGFTNNDDNLTVVSGYWNVTNKYSNGKYNDFLHIFSFTPFLI